MGTLGFNLSTRIIFYCSIASPLFSINTHAQNIARPARAYSIPSNATSESVDVPCIENDLNRSSASKCQIGLALCEGSQENKGTKGTVGTKDEIINLVRENIRLRSDLLREGKDLDSSASQANGEVTSRTVGSKVCNPLEGRGNNARCGRLPKIDGDRRAGILGTANRFGERIEANQHGMTLAAWNCHRLTVEEEIRNGRLRISRTTLDIAKDYQKLIETTKGREKLTTEFFESAKGTAAEKLAENFCKQADIQKTENRVNVPDICRKGEQNQENNWDYELQELVKHRISACNLAAARASTEGAFAHLAELEIKVRARHHVENLREGSNPPFMIDMQENLILPCQSNAAGPCRRRCRRKTSRSRAIECAEDCMADKITKCLADVENGGQGQYEVWVKDFFSKNFPLGGCNAGMSTSLSSINDPSAEDREFALIITTARITGPSGSRGEK